MLTEAGASEEVRTRKKVNIILPNHIYQRGQIMTWSLAEKREIVLSYGVGMVVNFWSKLDSDMSEVNAIYIYAPTPHSADMLHENNELLALYVRNYLFANPEKSALILCEAGKTRSVFFSVLLLSYYSGIKMSEALLSVEKSVGKHSLKAPMLEYIRNGGT